MPRKTRRIAVVGSSSFPLTPEVGAEIIDVLRGFPIQTTVFLTRGSPGFDTFILTVCPIIGYAALAFPAAGGSKNWDRDVALVRDADEVVGFLDPDTLHDLNTGTAHVLSKALDQGKPTRAFTVANRHLVYAGSSD